MEWIRVWLPSLPFIKYWFSVGPSRGVFSQPLEVRCDCVPRWLMKQRKWDSLFGEKLWQPVGAFRVGVIFLPGNCARGAWAPLHHHLLSPPHWAKTGKTSPWSPVPQSLRHVLLSVVPSTAALLFPFVLRYLPEFAHIPDYWVGDAISPSHPLPPPSSFCLQSFPASGSFPMSQLFASHGQSIGASASVLPMSIQGWFSIGLTGLISLQSKGLSRVFSSTTVQNASSSALSLFYCPTLASICDDWKNHNMITCSMNEIWTLLVFSSWDLGLGCEYNTAWTIWLMKTYTSWIFSAVDQNDFHKPILKFPFTEDEWHRDGWVTD